MKNYLLLLALAWMPFAHGCGFITPTSEKKEFDYFWAFSGSGEVVINFIPPTEKPSMKVFFKKDGKMKEVTDKKEISRWITLRKTGTKESKFIFITLEKDAPHQILVRINMHAHKLISIDLHDQVRLKIAKTEEMLRNRLSIDCWDDSHLSFSKISTKLLHIIMLDNSKLSGTALNQESLYLDGYGNSNIHIENIACHTLILRGEKNSKISLKGKVNEGDIHLTDSSILTAPQLHIKEGCLLMENTAKAFLAIENIEEQIIRDEAQFTNEAQ